MFENDKVQCRGSHSSGKPLVCARISITGPLLLAMLTTSSGQVSAGSVIYLFLQLTIFRIIHRSFTAEQSLLYLLRARSLRSVRCTI